MTEMTRNLSNITFLINIALVSKVYFTQNKKKAVKNIDSPADFFFIDGVRFTISLRRRYQRFYNFRKKPIVG